MNEKRDTLKAALKALAEKYQPRLGAHATIEELIAYHSGEVSAEEKKRLQEHLVWCQECLELLLDWAAWIEAGQEKAPPVSEAEVAAAWQSLLARIQRWDAEVAAAGQTRETPIPAEEKIGLPPSAWRQRLGRLFTPAGIPYAVAASLLILSLALGAWNVLLRQENQRQAARLNEERAARDRVIAAATEQIEEARQQLEETARRSRQYETEIAELSKAVDELSQPQINVPIEDLQPREVIRGQGQGSTVQTIEVPSGANLFALILNVVDQESYPDYALEILDQRGKQVWREDGLQPGPVNNFTVALPRRLFPAGGYRIKLYGLRAGRRHLVEEYAVRIQYQRQ